MEESDVAQEPRVADPCPKNIHLSLNEPSMLSVPCAAFINTDMFADVCQPSGERRSALTILAASCRTVDLSEGPAVVGPQSR